VTPAPVVDVEEDVLLDPAGLTWMTRGALRGGGGEGDGDGEGGRCIRWAAAMADFRGGRVVYVAGGSVNSGGCVFGGEGRRFVEEAGVGNMLEDEGSMMGDTGVL
jgi:hypothetical protein